MLIYHYANPDRPLVQGGYWFNHGGILRNDIPDYLAPMDYVPNWDKDFICCCDNVPDLLLYFPEDLHLKLGGKYGIYEYNGNIIWQQDAIMRYLTADANKMRLMDQLDYNEIYRRLS
jgi:hypothetical protein